jgi:hypothetical protein
MYAGSQASGPAKAAPVGDRKSRFLRYWKSIDKEAQARIRSLQRELAAPLLSPAGPTTAEGKVALFRCLFRGRDDVFPKLWINPRTNRKGYAPACANEWVRGVCEKPRIKCSECPNQAFVPLSEEVVVDHLRGRYVIGVYPLLRDETCWFLAADFDGALQRSRESTRLCSPEVIPARR